MATTIDHGLQKLDSLIAQVPHLPDNLNEAETRFFKIDSVLDALGWDKVDYRLERHFRGDYSDYELGQPPKVIVEAKREGIVFDISTVKARRRRLKELMLLDESLKDAINQCRSYCVERGVQIGICTNGDQYIIFLASRSDGTPPAEGSSFVFYSLQDLRDNFSEAWKLLNPGSILSQQTHFLLRSETPIAVPLKLRDRITALNQRRFRNNTQQTLATLSQILLEDVPQASAMEKKFLKQCYCKPGSISRYAMVAKGLLATRYQGLGQDTIDLSPRPSDESNIVLTRDVWREAVSRRPIVVLGDAGVGKTTFIKNLFLVESENDTALIMIHIDLGTSATWATNTDEYILDEIEEQLRENYTIDIYEDSFVRAIWDLEIKRMRSGIYKEILAEASSQAESLILAKLEELSSNRPKHVAKSLEHLSKGRSKSIVIVLDNADQRHFEFQEGVFLKAQEVAANWDALVFIALRPYTYYLSRKTRAVSGYSNRVFTILPPRPDEVLERRIQFAIDIAEGRVAFPDKKINLQVETVSLVLQSLLHSLRTNTDLVSFLANITGGNIRELVNITARFVGSSNVDFAKILDIMRQQGQYDIPVHEFEKEVLLGEYNYYDSETSIAHNIFDIRMQSLKEHFLDLYILGVLASDTLRRDFDGFVEKATLLNELERLGFTNDVISWHVNRLGSKNLLENNLRIPLTETEIGLFDDDIISFRETTVGVYHVKRWSRQFAYLDAILIDTPILDDTAKGDIADLVESFNIRDRLRRTEIFKRYLDSCWAEAGEPTPYFDWAPLSEQAGESLALVQRRSTRK